LSDFLELFLLSGFLVGLACEDLSELFDTVLDFLSESSDFSDFLSESSDLSDLSSDLSDFLGSDLALDFLSESFDLLSFSECLDCSDTLDFLSESSDLSDFLSESSDLSDFSSDLSGLSSDLLPIFYSARM